MLERDSNVAMGDEAGNNIIDGSDNVAIGAGAGTNVTSGTGNVYVGANVVGPGDEIRFVRIGDTVPGLITHSHIGITFQHF